MTLVRRDCGMSFGISVEDLQALVTVWDLN